MFGHVIIFNHQIKHKEDKHMYKLLQIVDTFIRWITCNEYHLTFEREEIKHEKKAHK